MAQSSEFRKQVQANLAKLEARPDFDADRPWLTFYLMGPPENLEGIAETLNQSGWNNVGGWEGGFLYPKVRVGRTVSAIVETAERVRRLCSKRGAEILNIDADSTPDMNSRCVTLYRSRA